MKREDDRLKAHFRELRRADERLAPSFESQLALIRARCRVTPLRRVRRFAAAAVLVVAVGVAAALWPRASEAPALIGWRSPTDGLLTPPPSVPAPSFELAPSFEPVAAVDLAAWHSPSDFLLPEPIRRME